MASTEKQKQSLYFPDEMLREIMREATRLDRSLSWTVQQAWRVAREEVKKFPSPQSRSADVPGAPSPQPSRASAANGRQDDFENRRPSAQVLEFLRGKFDSELAG